MPRRHGRGPPESRRNRCGAEVDNSAAKTRLMHLSFNECTASLFVTGQRAQTLPIAMHIYVREYADLT
jgi:hypothetical protein